MKRVLLVATVQSHIAQFHKPLIGWLQNSGCQVDVAARNNLDLKPNLHLDIAGDIFDIPFERSPFSVKNIKAYVALKKVIRDGQYDVVHCNTPVAGILTRIAANAKRKKGELKVIYEAHGFHFYKGGPLKNWILWYPIEKLFSYITDVLITINQEDFALAQAKMKAGRVEYVHGVGIDVEKFTRQTINKVEKRNELNIPQNAKLLLSIGELNRNKNHETVIRAIKDMDVFYLIAGNGPLENNLREIVYDLGLSNRVRFLGYRRDIGELCTAADLFVFPSLREGLPVSLLEAMASGLPVVCSQIRGNTDLIDEYGGALFDPLDVENCKKAIIKILSGDLPQYGAYNSKRVQQFSLEIVNQEMRKIYWEAVIDGN